MQITPADLIDKYWPYLRDYIPDPGDPVDAGPPMILTLLTADERVISGPIFLKAHETDPCLFLSKIHPGALPGKPRIIQACLSAEVLTAKSVDATIKFDAVTVWGITVDEAFISVLPFARFVDAGETHIEFYEEGAENGPETAWGSYDPADLNEPVLQELHRILTTDPESVVPYTPDVRIIQTS